MPWKITRDFLAEQEENPDPPGTMGNDVGIMGPSSYKGDGKELKKKFRMLDGDNTLCYEGYCDTDDDENALIPLDDFGTGNVGATTIQYKVNRKWTNLN